MIAVERDTAGRSALVRAIGATRVAVDDVRIRTHLRRAERDLRATDHDLPPERAECRERALNHLRAYRQRGEFPRNREAIERTPCFVGVDGSPCAVGSLLLANGRADLFIAVVRTENTVSLEDIEGGPVVEWFKMNGLAQAEAARIQSSYPESVHFATTCGPAPCWLARSLASVVGLAAFALAEWVGYWIAGDLFLGNALKRRAALGYLTILNLLLAPLMAALVYTLFP